MFVKPAHLGSSVGIVKVSEPGALERALEEAFAHDELVIVEAMAQGASRSSAGCSARCMRERDSDGPPALASEPGEIVLRASGTTSTRSTRPAAWS